MSKAASKSVYERFTEGDYRGFLTVAVREELKNPTSTLLSYVFAANVAVWKLTDATMCATRMQHGDRSRFEALLVDLNSCAFADAVNKASFMPPEVSKAIRVGVVGKAMQMTDNDVYVASKLTSIPADEAAEFYRIHEASVSKGWGPDTARELARVAAFIQV